MSELSALSRILDKDPLEMTPIEFAIWVLSATDEDRAEEAAQQLEAINVGLEMLERLNNDELGELANAIEVKS